MIQNLLSIQTLTFGLTKRVNKMNVQKTFKANAQDNNNSWQYQQEVKQSRKASKELRNNKRSRKGFWLVSGE